MRYATIFFAALFMSGSAQAQSFTTAAEVRPILGATKSSWVALREYDGNDLLYFTHLVAWRCGLTAVWYTVNGGEAEPWVMEPCYEAEPAPGAIKAEEHLPYVVFDLHSVQTVTVELEYDDGERGSAAFSRAEIHMP